MDFFESKKSIDLIDVSINQRSLQISTNLVTEAWLNLYDWDFDWDFEYLEVC